MDEERVKLKIGAVFGLIGATILLIAGLTAMTMNRYMVEQGDLPIFVPYITAIVTSAVAALGILGAVSVFRDNNTGYTFLLVAGIIGIIGTFIPIYSWDSGWGYIQNFYLTGSAAFIDVVFMVVGAVLGFAFAEKKERE